MLLYLNESTERSISCFEFANARSFRLNDRPFAQGAYIFQVKRTFHFFKNVTGFINKLRDDLSVIDLISGAKSD